MTAIAGPLFGHWYAQHNGELLAHPQDAEGGKHATQPPPHPSTLTDSEWSGAGWYAPDDLVGDDREQVLHEFDVDPSAAAGVDLTRQADGGPSHIAVESLTNEQLGAVLTNNTDTYPDAGKVAIPTALYELGRRADSDPGAATVLEQAKATDAAKAQVAAAAEGE